MALASPASASPAGDLAAATNSARAKPASPRSLLTPSSPRSHKAWANHLAAANVLSHNGALRAQVSNWSVLGENVGMAGDIPSVQAAFLASPEHRANILNAELHPDGRRVGFVDLSLVRMHGDLGRRRLPASDLGAAVAAAAKPAAPVATPGEEAGP